MFISSMFISILIRSSLGFDTVYKLYVLLKDSGNKFVKCKLIALIK